ncbi:MAG TPA: hypothetical protein VFY68_01270 [Nitrososphaeraceae archaeon]|nr:hypothetical protein [Nitrososphaeraceae archaeon]
MSTNNSSNSAEIIVKGSTFQEREWKEEDNYPDPNTLPLPSQEQRIVDVTLSELIPGKYVTTTARVVYLRAIEKQDALGPKMIFSGILEDSKFKVPFVSHRISYPLIRNCVYKFQSAYVHEFPEKSLLVVITEHTKISPKDVEDYREYIWKPTVDSIKRPVKSVALQGVITTVHGNSGLIKRCNKCKSILYDDACPNKCPEEEGWGWDLRVSCKLYDGSGSIKMVLTKDIASKVLQRNLAELVLLASSKMKSLPSNNGNRDIQLPPSSEITLKLPDTIDVIEAVTENDASSSSYRSSNKIIISDGRNLVYFPPGEEDEHKFSEYTKRPLNISEIEDRKIVRRLIEKALDIGIRKVTGMKKMQGIYLLEEPVPLYRCEQAKLYLGFSIQVIIREEKEEKGNNIVAVIEATPQSYVRESVLDYVRLRRGRGASANSVISNLTKYRNKVIVAPSGNYGCIVDVISKKAGSQQVSDNDHRNLVEFWKQIYGIDISPDEIPLLKVKMMNSENVFTYPSSMCFFGTDSFFIPAYVQKFVEYKRSTIKSRMDKVIQELVNEEDTLKIGDTNLEFGGQAVSNANANKDNDIQVQLLQEVRQKLFGRSVMARGSAMFVHDEIWFFPNQLRIS